MPQQHTISRNNTTVKRNQFGQVESVTLHSTEIFNQDETGTVTINDGGHVTATTTTRLNQIFNSEALQLRAFRSGACMYVSPTYDDKHPGFLVPCTLYRDRDAKWQQFGRKS